jgi:hypothetical protein
MRFSVDVSRACGCAVGHTASADVLLTGVEGFTRLSAVDPQLQAIVDDLDAASRRVSALRASVASGVWSGRQAAGQWSPAECLEHLNLMSAALLPVIRHGLQEAHKRGPWQVKVPYRRNLMGSLVWAIMGPGRGIKTKTIAAFMPAGEQSVEALVAGFERLQADILACVRAADGLPIDQVRIASPFDSRLRYNLYAVLTLVPRHQHRHLHQAERAIRAASVHPAIHTRAAANSTPKTAIPIGPRGSNLA